MKNRKNLLLIILILLLPSFIATAQKTDLSGEWKLNREKSNTGDSPLTLTKITFQVKSDTLLSTRVYESEQGEFPFDENLTLDGKDCKTVIYDMPRTSKATKNTDGSIVISSATTFNGNNGEEDMVARETWKLDDSGKFLVLEFSNKMSGGETTGTYYYEKAN